MTEKPGDRATPAWEKLERGAGGGLLDRRAYLRGVAAIAAAVTGYARSATGAPLQDEPWSLAAGGITPGI